MNTMTHELGFLDYFTKYEVQGKNFSPILLLSLDSNLCNIYEQFVNTIPAVRLIKSETCAFLKSLFT